MCGFLFLRRKVCVCMTCVDTSTYAIIQFEKVCENMAFDTLYHLSEGQIQNVYKQFSISFQEDDLYIALYPDEKQRAKFLRFFFQHYIKLIAPYCHFVGDSSACHSVMIVFDSTLETKFYIFRALWFNIKVIAYLLCLRSMQGIQAMFQLWDMFTSQWTKDFVSEEYYHMDLIYTKQDMQGQGLATNLMETLLLESRLIKRDVTMETHHKENLKLYENIGFTCMSTMSKEPYHVCQYNMLYRVKEV